MDGHLQPRRDPVLCAHRPQAGPRRGGASPACRRSRASTRTASYAASTQPWSRITGSVRNPSPSGIRRWAWGRIRARPIRTKRGMGPRSVTRRQPSSCRNRGPTNRSKRIRPQSSCLPPPPELGSRKPVTCHGSGPSRSGRRRVTIQARRVVEDPLAERLVACRGNGNHGAAGLVVGRTQRRWSNPRASPTTRAVLPRSGAGIFIPKPGIRRISD